MLLLRLGRGLISGGFHCFEPLANQHLVGHALVAVAVDYS